MIIHTARSQIKKQYPRPVVAIGVFDGLHRGHQKIIRQTVRRAAQIRGTPMVITFAPHPVHVLNPKVFCPLIISVEHRLKLIEEMGVKVGWVIPFTRRFARGNADEFFHRYLINPLSPSEIVVGDDFHFGRGRQASAAYLQALGPKHGIAVRCLSVGSGPKSVSSSRIRRDIATGNLKHAASLLGRPFAVLGRVIHGDSRGRKLGYPTANIHLTQQLLPPSGVYIVKVKLGSRTYPGIANLGHRPSFKKIARVNLEVHLFNLRQNLYARRILVQFLRKIRDEKVFRSQAELVRQIRLDEKQARRWFHR